MVIFTNFTHPTEGIKIQQPSTTVFNNDREMGKGTLYVSESVLSWVNGSTGEGFSLEYENIAIHAVSRDIQAHGFECVYLMLDTRSVPEMEDAEESPSEDEDGVNEDKNGLMIEMKLVPEDKGCLDAIFEAISACQALHPDPEEANFSDDDDIFEDADEEGEYHIGNGDAPFIHYEEEVERINGQNQEEAMEMDGQFEDADYVPDE